MSLRPGRRRLSSRWTFFHKVIFPAGWIAVFLVGTVAMFITPAESNEARTVRWLLLAVTVFGAALILHVTLPLKHVEVGDRSFFVSDRTREVEVPFRDVARVTGTRLVNPPRVTLHLHRAGELGDRVVFLPPLRFRSGFKTHPMVKELQAMIADTQSR